MGLTEGISSPGAFLPQVLEGLVMVKPTRPEPKSTRPVLRG